MTSDASSPFDGLGLHIGGIVHLSAREAFACVQAGAVILDVRDGLERNGRSFAVSGVTQAPGIGGFFKGRKP